MQPYKNKPTVVHAEQFDGTRDHAEKLFDLINTTAFEKGWDQEAWVERHPDGERFIVGISAAFNEGGNLFLHPTNWLMFGTEGEYYPCKDSVFREKYEAVTA